MLLCTPAASSPAAAGYTFTNIADNTGPYTSFVNVGTPAINNAGKVVFVAGVDAGWGGVFTGPDPLAHAVATTNGPYSYVGGFLVINTAGTVAFYGRDDSEMGGIFTGSDPVAHAVATTAGPYSHVWSPTINDAGTVAFHAPLDAGGAGIFTGPNPVTVVSTAAGDGLYESLGDGGGSFPSINDAGTVAFYARDYAGRDGIFTGPDPDADAVVTTDGAY